MASMIRIPRYGITAIRLAPRISNVRYSGNKIELPVVVKIIKEIKEDKQIIINSILRITYWTVDIIAMVLAITAMMFWTFFVAVVFAEYARFAASLLRLILKS